MPKVLGHGISDAVRNHIPVWVDEELVDVMYTEYTRTGGVLNKQGFRARIKQSDIWVRKSRRSTNTGWERKYQCKAVQKATLIVHSPEADESANSYVFFMDDKPIAGGKTKLKSVNVSTAVSKKDKTSTRYQDVMFVKFTEEELRSIRIRMEFGDGFDRLELERG